MKCVPPYMEHTAYPLSILPEALLSCGRILHLDADALVLTDVRHLFYTPLHGAIAGAAQNFSLPLWPRPVLQN